MSYASIGTRNEIGVRRDYSRRALAGVGVHRAPAETPPVSALYPTHQLSGVRDYNTQSVAHAMGAASPATNPNVSVDWMPAWLPRNSVIARVVSQNPRYQTPFSSSPTPFQPAPPASTQTTPTPTTSPTSPPPGGVAISSGGPAATTAQPGTPVPVGTPTNQSYTDQNGNIWTFTPSAGWQVTGTTAQEVSGALPPAQSSGAAGSVTPGTTVTVQSGSTMWQSITSWLQGSSFSLGSFAVPNFFIVAGVGLVGLWLYGGGKRR